jgi:hypothetical protein
VKFSAETLGGKAGRVSEEVVLESYTQLPQ